MKTIKVVIQVFILDACINVFFRRIYINTRPFSDTREKLLTQIHYIYNKHYLDLIGYQYSMEQIREVYLGDSLKSITDDLEELKSGISDEDI